MSDPIARRRRPVSASTFGALLAVGLLSTCGLLASGVAGAATPVRFADRIMDTSGPAQNGPQTPPEQLTFDAEIGDCVQLSGNADRVRIANAPCGHRAANYKVVQKTTNHADCVADADAWYANTRDGVEIRAFCLDVDWVVGDCFADVDYPAARTDCVAPPAHARRITSISTGTSTDSCASDGKVYRERKIVVCAEAA